MQRNRAVATMLGGRRLTAETLNTLGGLELATRSGAGAAGGRGAGEPESHTIFARVAQKPRHPLSIIIRGDLDLAKPTAAAPHGLASP